MNLAAGQVSIRHNAKGPNEATCTACTTSAHSIGDAARIIKYGDADVMIAGGSEAAITPMGVGGFAAMRALSTRNDDPHRASRPWDKDRDGFVIGEGAGILILEELEHAKKRGAKIIAEVSGYGMSADANHITQPAEDGEGGFRVMRNAMRDAGIQPEQVGYVNAHGTSTPLGDELEAMAVKRAFADHAYKMAVSSTKSMTGHLLGGAGGLEAGITVLALRDQIVPPTMNWMRPAKAAIWTSYPTQLARWRWSTPCRTPSASAEPTDVLYFGGGRSRVPASVSGVKRRHASAFRLLCFGSGYFAGGSQSSRRRCAYSSACSSAQRSRPAPTNARSGSVVLSSLSGSGTWDDTLNSYHGEHSRIDLSE